MPLKIYSASIASDGQTETQAPQSMHFSASMVYFGSPSEIASTGHSGLQLPQAVHLSVILCVIDFILS